MKHRKSHIKRVSSQLRQWASEKCPLLFSGTEDQDLCWRHLKKFSSLMAHQQHMHILDSKSSPHRGLWLYI